MGIRVSQPFGSFLRDSIDFVVRLQFRCFFVRSMAFAALLGVLIVRSVLDPDNLLRAFLLNVRLGPLWSVVILFSLSLTGRHALPSVRCSQNCGFLAYPWLHSPRQVVLIILAAGLGKLETALIAPCTAKLACHVSIGDKGGVRA